MYKVALFTPSYRAVEKLDRIFDIKVIFCERNKNNLMLYNYCKWRSIPLLVIHTESEISKAIPEDIEIGISFGFGIIFKKLTISRFLKGIWNIHTGSLPEYRGRHPIAWAFLKGDNKIGVVVHQIDISIDKGKLLAFDYVYRDINDDLSEINNKIIDLIGRNIMHSAIENYKKNCMPLIGKGDYLDSFLNGIVIHSVLDVDSDFLFNSVRAQRTFGGVQIKGKLYKDAYYYTDEFSDLLKRGDIVECKDGIKIVLFERKITI
jgi:methionyl-tRNA formyltransferase